MKSRMDWIRTGLLLLLVLVVAVAVGCASSGNKKRARPKRTVLLTMDDDARAGREGSKAVEAQIWPVRNNTQNPRSRMAIDACVRGMTDLGGSRRTTRVYSCMMIPISTPATSNTHGRLSAPRSLMNCARVSGLTML